MIIIVIIIYLNLIFFILFYCTSVQMKKNIEAKLCKLVKNIRKLEG